MMMILSIAVLAMEEHDIQRVPVVNYAGRLVGIISREDVCIGVRRELQSYKSLAGGVSAV